MISASGQGVRRRSREMALQLLFQSEFAGSRAGSVSTKEILQRFIDDFRVERDVAEYGSTLFLGVSSRLNEIDVIIQDHSSHWRVSRMGLVDLSVMRVAVFEMRFLDPALTPHIVIDEAIEIARTFGSTESSSFVNGILDHIARKSNGTESR